MYKVILLGNTYIEEAIKISFSKIKDIEIRHVMPNESLNGDECFIYCAMDETNKQDDSGLDLKRLVEHSFVLPVLTDMKHFVDWIPDELHAINGIQVDTECNNIHTLKNRILEYWGMIETNRKVFISYKRSDSSDLAVALFGALVKNRYIPFLDDYSINTGVDFQEYLMHELSDSAIFLFINSSNYEMSKFTRAELSACNELQLGVVELRTADATQYMEGIFASTIDLPSDKKKWTDQECVRNIIAEIDKVRINMYDFRENKFRDIFCCTEGRDKITDPFVRDDVSYFPIYHIPTSFDVHHVEQSIEHADIHKIRIAYDGLYCNKEWRKHIDWLNNSLPVKVKDINNL